MDRPSASPTSERPAARAVVGVPLYNGERSGHLEGALRSLLSQTYPHVAFVLVDDASADDTFDVVSTLTAGDPRVVLRRNASRLGLVDNWRRVFALGTELFPSAEYFAWASDHDRWDERWLETLVARLDESPDAVLAYSLFSSVDERERPADVSGRRAGVDTSGLARPARFAAASDYKIGAGNLVYGLFRRAALQRVGVYPRVSMPDVYIMIELSLHGEIVRVRDLLWQRRYWSQEFKSQRRRESALEPASIAAPGDSGPAWRRWPRGRGSNPASRKQRHIFATDVPFLTRLPVSLQHVALFFWRIVVLGRGQPRVGRGAGAWYTFRLTVAGWRTRRTRARKERRAHVRRERESRWAAKKELRRAARRKQAESAERD